MQRVVRVVLPLIIIQVIAAWGLAADSPEAAGLVPVPMLDLAKASANLQTAWLEHVLWPTAETIAAKRYAGDVTPEKDELRARLDKVLAEGYRPSEQDLAERLIPISDPWGDPAGPDYLLLQYTTKSGMRIDVQDGQDIYMSVYLAQSSPLADVESLIRKVGSAVFNPAALPQDTSPIVGSLQVDIGASRTGNLCYGVSRTTNAFDWYTNIPWWSDGQRITFLVSKMDFAKLATTAHWSPRPARKFSSRGQPKSED